ALLDHCNEGSKVQDRIISPHHPPQEHPASMLHTSARNAHCIKSRNRPFLSAICHPPSAILHFASCIPLHPGINPKSSTSSPVLAQHRSGSFRSARGSARE